jgi:hypothetical protein
MEQALAEHVAAHPEDAGHTVDDFDWIVQTIVPPWLGRTGAAQRSYCRDDEHSHRDRFKNFWRA